MAILNYSSDLKGKNQHVFCDSRPPKRWCQQTPYEAQQWDSPILNKVMAAIAVSSIAHFFSREEKLIKKGENALKSGDPVRVRWHLWISKGKGESQYEGQEL